MVAIASINGSKKHLMREGGKVNLLRCNVAISTSHPIQNYLLDSI